MNIKGISKILSLICTLSVFLCLSVPAQQRRGLTIDNSRSEKRFALVIGNSDYDIAPLRNSVNDAKDMAQTLATLGFEVIYKENVRKEDMKRVVRLFGDKIRNGGIGLFYFAGHGLQVKGLNYLVPVDAKLSSEEEVEYECIEVGFVLALMETARNDMNIIILDACRNNPFARSFRSISRGLAPINAPPGTLIAYATGPGFVASDGNGRNGIYTQELLRNLTVPDLGIEEVFKRVRISVLYLTQSKQTPWESSSLTRDFYFAGSKSTSSPAIKKNPGSPTTVDIGPTSPDTPRRPGQIVKENFFTFELQECKRSGSTISCEFVITNNNRDRYFDIMEWETVMYDDFGKESKDPSITIAEKTGYHSISLLVSGVPTKAAVGFGGISPEATKISLLTIHCLAPETSNGMGGDRFKIQFRNIPLNR